jgi:hypothetical protein
MIDHRHPASTAASESPVAPMPRLLGADEMSRRTKQLIAARAALLEASPEQHDHAEPAPDTPAKPSDSTTPPKKPTGHEHH